MTLDDELKRLGLLNEAAESFGAKLDAMANDPTPRVARMVSHEPKEGYFWNSYFEHYEEGDELFRKRIMVHYMDAMTDPRKTVLLESGHGLDAIGARPEIELPRNGIETDHDYRNRLIERMREIDAQTESAG